jgi:hypothetical protein
MTMKFLLLAAVAGAALLTPTLGNATPSLGLAIYDGLTLLGSTSSASGSAVLSLAGTLNYSFILVTANGVPLIPTPNLNSVTLDTTSKAPATLTVWVTQTGLTNLFPINLASSFTINKLTGLSESVTITNYIDASNAAYGTATQIGSDTLAKTGVVGDLGPINFAAPAMTLFSETQKYVINFDAAFESVSLSSQIVDAPEPVSIAMLGVGMLGLGMVRRSKRAV